MESYRFRLIDGEVVRVVDLEHCDEIEAFKTAEALARHFDVELSHGSQFLALVLKKGRTAAALLDKIDAVRRSSDARASTPG